jgi:hypothetical protein
MKLPRIAMQSVNYKSNTKSSQSLNGEVIDMPLPPMLRPHCGIWAQPGRVEIMFRLDTQSSDMWLSRRDDRCRSEHTTSDLLERIQRLRREQTELRARLDGARPPCQDGLTTTEVDIGRG